MLFKNISNFSNISDYLPILNAVLLVDIVGIIMSFTGIIKSLYLRKWYINYKNNAVIADVLVIVFGIIIARFFYTLFFKNFYIFLFVLLALIIQITHDILFYVMFSSVPQNKNKMLDFFKKYAREVKEWAIIGDSIMMISACLISSILANLSLNSNIILFLFLVYLLPYILNTY
jgi:hypothetical protein